MSDLTSRQMEALRDLSRRKETGDVAFINIADALALTEMGLALYRRGGWEITPEGSALLLHIGDSTRPS